MMVLNISRSMKENVCSLTQAKWKDRGIRYLGIKFSSKIEHMVTDNVVNLLKTVKQHLEVWTKLHLSWFGKIAVIKMNVLLQFCLKNMNLTIPQKVIN